MDSTRQVNKLLSVSGHIEQIYYEKNSSNINF